jgi:DNA ligase (NAD+)
MSSAFQHEHASQQDYYQHLVHCSNAYYNSGQPIISDHEFDQLVTFYEKKFQTTFHYLGKANNNKIKLPTLMPSLNKVKDQHAIDLFLKSVSKLYSRKLASSYVISSKVDGVSCLFVYSNHHAQLMTRGDGSVGSDISHLLPYLPMFRSIKKDIVIRGELVLYRKDSKSFENDVPRNIVSGLVNAKTPNPDHLGLLHFVGYFIEGLPSRDTFSALKALGIETPFHCTRSSIECTEDALKALLLEEDQKSPYDIDGLVLTTSQVVEAPTLDNPKYAVAFKVQKESVQTKVVMVEWNPSRYGQLYPRVQLEPVAIGGVTVTYATAFNAKFICDHRIGPDTLVSIVRSGDVIPYIVSVDKHTVAQMPTTKWKWVSDVHIALDGTETSDDVKRNKLVHFIEVIQVKGFKEAAIQKLIEAGYDTEEKLLFLTLADLLQIPSLTGVKGNCTKTCEKIAQGLLIAREQLTLEQLLLGSSTFPAFGEKKLQIAANAIDIPDYLSRSVDDSHRATCIQKLQEAGIKTLAKPFIECLDLFKKQFQASKILTFALSKSKPKVTPSKEATIAKGPVVFTGFRDATLKTTLEERGYTVMNSVSGKTVAVIVDNIEGEKEPSSKIKEAMQRGVKLISKENALKDLV